MFCLLRPRYECSVLSLPPSIVLHGWHGRCRPDVDLRLTSLICGNDNRHRDCYDSCDPFFVLIVCVPHGVALLLGVLLLPCNCNVSASGLSALELFSRGIVKPQAEYRRDAWRNEQSSAHLLLLLLHLLHAQSWNEHQPWLSWNFGILEVGKSMEL